MSEDHFGRIKSASKVLADAIREYSVVLGGFGSEVGTHYYSGLAKDRSTQQSLESVIDGALETISSHTSHLQLVQASLRQTKNTLNPINSLRPELLARIFSLIPDQRSLYGYRDVFESYPADSYHLGRYTKQARLSRSITLSSVCRYWRSVALGTSTFWAYIPLYLLGQAAQSTLDRAPILLDRARTTPIELSLNIQSVSAILTKLHVDIRRPSDEPSTLQDWLPRFQELQILHLNPGTLHYDHVHALPKLVELDLFFDGSHRYPLPMKRLANVLRACPGLQRLRLEGLEFTDAADADLTPISFPYLDTIYLQHLHVASVSPLLSSRSSSLNLSIYDNALQLSNDNLADHIAVFSQRTTMTGLYLNVAGFGGDLHRLLSLFPHIRTLSLENVHLDDPTVHTLQEATELDLGTEAVPSPFPTLQAIWLTGVRLDTEETLHSLVSPWALRQLKLERCMLLTTGSILRAQTLVDYLLSSIPDLIITE
ncbi:hypothetical protein BDV93DRAFT_596058 [Ceratobasidium sp. AG-I]|nr:hypothetical protein BDV93DRAFT_596058 [Ceratobasidium sp. AG-I]